MKNRLDKTIFNARTCFWNINGRTYLLTSDFILKWLQTNFDIVFITETHLTEGTRFSLPDFKEFHNPLSDHNDPHPHGGISCFIKKSNLHLIKKVDKNTSEMIVVEITGGHKIFSNYIVPITSPYADESNFSKVANVFLPKDSDRIVFGGGDLNSRVGDISQKLPINCSYRPNVDTTVNEYGKLIHAICQSFSCFVLNNMDIGEKHLEGKFTFNKGGRKSQNDIIVSNASGIRSVTRLSIHEVGWNPSDHTPVSVECRLDVTDHNLAAATSFDILSQPHCNTLSKAKKIQHEKVNWDTYKVLTEYDYRTYDNEIIKLSINQNLENLDAAVNSLSDSLYNTAHILVPPKNKVDDISTVCIEDPLITEANRVHKQWLRGEKSDEEYDSVHQEVITHLKQNVSSKERKAWSAVLKENDPKALWQKINWKGTLECDVTSTKPPLDELREHFLKKGQSVEDSTLLCDVTGDSYVPELDDEISLEEIDTVINKAKEDKSSADGWAKKMVACLPVCIMYAIQIIYNTILSTHTYPTRWRNTVVNEIFKNKGSPDKAPNYRGISLVYYLSKLFDFILCGRFTKWFQPDDGQTAYQNRRSGADHVFLIRCLVQQAKRLKEKIFLIAVDFDGAFDRISRSLLIRKLISFGAGTIFVACIASMYMCTDNIIFRNKDYVTYMLYSGIKQGLPLSPILFIFYINDIFARFREIHGRCVDNIFKLLHLLVHADDVTLIAVSREMSISKLCTLATYCLLNHIIPQVTKCKFIVINGTDGDKEPLPFGDSLLKLDNVDHLEILGSHISELGRLDVDLELHMKKRFKSCIKFFNFCRENKLAPVSVRIKALTACVMSLLHNCEAFGDRLPKTLAKAYNQLIRAALQVRPNTPNLIVYIESGLLPIKALVEARQYKFISRFTSSLSPTGDRKIVFDKLLNNPPKYLKHYQDLLRKYKNHHEIYRSHVEDTKTKIRDHASKGKYKYEIYLKLNPELQCSPFLHSMHPSTPDIIKFRVGSHRLPIEMGRWSNVKREDRLCTTCNVLGDEEHVLYNCALIARNDLDICNDLSRIWEQEDVFRLFRRIKTADYF